MSSRDEFLLALEMERNDLSYLRPRRVKVETIVVSRNVYPKSRKLRDKLMFDAGRYAAGDRDWDARLAYSKYLEAGGK